MILVSSLVVQINSVVLDQTCVVMNVRTYVCNVAMLYYFSPGLQLYEDGK